MSEKQATGVYKAIAKITAAMASEGIGKDRKNQQQGYSFRGIDDVYNVLSRMLADAGLCIIPRILKRDMIERQTQKGGTLFYVTVEAEYDLIAVEDGSKHTARVFGEAMDSGDKATNKAMSAAYKYLAFQTFAIPTEGDNDADAHTHEVKPSQARPAPVKTPPAPTLDNEDMDDLKQLAKTLIQLVEGENNPSSAYDMLDFNQLDNEKKRVLWAMLSPNTKKAISDEKLNRAIKTSAAI